MPRRGILILMVCLNTLDIIQYVEAEEKELLQPSIEDLNPAGNGGGKSEKKENGKSR